MSVDRNHQRPPSAAGRSAPGAPDVLVVGAGLSGLVAAGELARGGLRVVIVDKGRGVGGRLASRRLDGATFDHGAQRLSAGAGALADMLQAWAGEGVISPWPAPAAGDIPSWRGVPAMTAVAKRLAQGLDVRLAMRVTALRRDREGWAAATEAGEVLRAGAVLLTAPTPQSLAILDAGATILPREMRARVEAVRYEPCLAVLVVPAGDTAVPTPGWLEPGEGPIATLVDNRAKGVSAEPAITILATPAFSLANWDRDRAEAGAELVAAAATWLPGGAASFQVHGWLYSRPLDGERPGCLVLNGTPPLVLAGDAFGGPDAAGAVDSGLAAARLLARAMA